MCRLCNTKEPDCDQKHGLCLDCLSRNLAMHRCKLNMTVMHGTMLMPDGSMVYIEELRNPRGMRQTRGIINAWSPRIRKHLHCDPDESKLK